MGEVFSLRAFLGLDSSEYEKGLDKALNAGSALGSGLATAASVGLKAVTAATTAVVGFGTASVATGQEFDRSMSQVAATMGDKANDMVEYNGNTVSSMEALRDFAQEMGRTTAFSATQAADALNYMALAGYDAETSINMLPNVLNLAAAGSIDLARASDMITDTQTAFGISLERTTQMVDEMAKAASTGNTSVEQLGDAFLVVGGLAQDLNGGLVTLEDGSVHAVDGVQELEIALTAMANAGIKGSEAGTHMRNMLLKLSSPTEAGTNALEAMGVAVFDTEGNMRSLVDIFTDLSGAMGEMTQEQKLQTIADLFNTRDIASAEALLNAVTQDWDNIGQAIIGAWGDVDSFNQSFAEILGGEDAFNRKNYTNLDLSKIIYILYKILKHIEPDSGFYDELKNIYIKYNIILNENKIEISNINNYKDLSDELEKLYDYNSESDLIIDTIKSGKAYTMYIKKKNKELQEIIKNIKNISKSMKYNEVRSKYAPFKKCKRYYEFTGINFNFFEDIK